MKSEDFIAVAIISNLKTRGYSILLSGEDVERGGLIVNSKIKPDKTFSVKKKPVGMNIRKANNSNHDKVRAQSPNS